MRKLRRRLFGRRKSTRRIEPSPNLQHADAVPDLSGSPQRPSFPDGVKVLHDCPGATVDICFVHGLTGDRESTWTAQRHSASWPQTLLPSKLGKSRILTYGYDAYVVRGVVAGSNRLLDHAKNLLHDLTMDREGDDASSRPLIFVAHSLGGLVCKKAILLSRNNPEVHLRGIFDCTKGIIFMGTPHKGSWMADWAKIPASALGLAKVANKSLLEILQTDSQLLESDQLEFWSMVRELREGGRRFEVTCAFEELPLPVVGKVVSNTSATLEGYASFSIHANHSDMVRFVSAEENGFKRLLGVLTRWKIQLEPIAQPPSLSESSQKCLQSLAFPQMHDRSHDIDSAAAGTCEWLLQHEKYTTWAACGRGLLWIKGKPGSGKSTVLKHALKNHKAGDGALVISFFFHGRGDELQKTPLGFFRSLLHQILKQAPDALHDLVGVFESKCKNNGKQGAGWHWHEGELRPFFQESLFKVLRTRPIWLFVDALDECGRDNAVGLVEIFSSLLKSLQSQSEDLQQFHICFSCRHYPILDVDENRFEICTEHENERDISAFVKDKLAIFRAGPSSKIPGLITARASGVFMWARLVVEQILGLERDGAGLAKLEAAISALPPNLDELYRQLVQGMEIRSRELIQWVCFATRPLNIDELRWAMVIEDDCPYRSIQACESAEDYVADSARMKRQAQTLSRGLVEVNHAQTVQFIHESVRDFFFGNGLSVLGDDETLTEAAVQAHLRFSKICLRYLSMEEIVQKKGSLRYDNFPFLGYAAISWATHAERCDAGSAPIVPRDDLLALFAWPSDALVGPIVRVSQARGITSPAQFSDGSNLVHIASAYGLVGLLIAILNMGSEIDSEIDAKDNSRHTPLSWAVREGHKAVVRLLLDTGKVDVDNKDNRGVGHHCCGPRWGGTRLLYSYYLIPAKSMLISGTSGVGHHFRGPRRGGMRLLYGYYLIPAKSILIIRTIGVGHHCRLPRRGDMRLLFSYSGHRGSTSSS
ncbi:hypothetical protein F5144DRAFT_30163 [Chaetomium tenue]|uniref:Uncharacterized protein n=1 Tax=Chaetomium tenue TaxID=1854479 RepID=A0ACB7PQT9_9PEZI|nr:hypothetical protein F5144DRAFT_30163 [Chaetomium globosum]